MARCGVAASWLGAVWLALIPSSSVWALTGTGEGIGAERDGGGSDGDGIGSTSTFPGDSASSDWSVLAAAAQTTGQEPIDGLWKENLLKDASTSIDDRDKWKEFLFTNPVQVEADDVDDSPLAKAGKGAAKGVLLGEADASIDDSDTWKDYLFVNPIEAEGGGDETSTPGKAEKDPTEGVLIGETDASWSILESTPSSKPHTNVPSSEPSNSPISRPSEVDGGDSDALPLAKAEKEGPEGVLTGEINAPWSISMNTPTTCPYGGSMDVESYGEEKCISFGQAICKNGWRIGISHQVDNTYLMLWREDQPSYPVFRWFPGASQMCIGEQYPNVSYLRVVHDDCEHYLVGPGAGRPGDLARLKIVEGSQNYRSGDVIVKFRDGPGDHNALWHIFADGHARTSYDTFWHHNPCETAKPTTSPADILVRGPSDKLSDALEDVAPTRTPTLESDHPTQSPIAAPVSNPPTMAPSSSPVSTSPTATPSSWPTTTEPTAGPIKGPSTAPVSNPPTQGPSFLPSSTPSSDPSVLASSVPSRTLSSHPSSQPSEVFSSIPSLNPSDSPTTTISNNPTFLSSSVPSLGPSGKPSASFSSMPTSAPSNVASSQSPSTPPPSLGPTANSSSLPSTSPTPQPTPSRTAKPSFRIAPADSQLNAEPAGYELAMTAPKEEWIWTRDYSSCNHRLKCYDERYFSGRLLLNPIIIYRIREPNLSSLQDSNLTRWEKLKLEYPDGPHNAEALMIDPVSRRIFILTKSSGTIWMTPEPWGAGPARVTLTKVGSIKTMPDLLTGIDISPDGKEIVVKFYNSIHYFCMGSRKYDKPEDSWQDIVDVLTMDDGIEVPYIEEPQGEAVCFGQNFDDGIFTLSESQGRPLIPLIHHVRL